MNELDDKQTLLLLRTMCFKEHALFEKNVPLLMPKLMDMVDQLLADKLTNSHSTKSPSVTYMQAYDSIVDCLTNTTNLLRKLNIQVQTIVQHSAVVAAASVDTTIVPVCADVAKPVDEIAVDRPLTIADLMPNYADRLYLSEHYQSGHNGLAVISHLMADTSTDQIIAYLLDTNAPNSSIMDITPAEFQRLQLIHEPPSHPALFGVCLDDVVFRARCLPVSAPMPVSSSIAVMLVDTGETVHITKRQTSLYSLPDAYVGVPAQAIPCRVLNSAAIAVHKYCMVRFLVVDSVLPDSTYVVVSVATEPELLAPRAAVPLVDNTNPFAQLIDESNEKLQRQKLESDPITNTTNTTNSINKHAATSVAAQLFDNDCPSTTNALVAVTGYAPRDDARICRHYDATTGGCFKGGACRLEHVPPMRDGWTRDQLMTRAKQRVTQPWPTVGASFILRVTHLVHVDRFYAQIVSDTLHDPRRPTMWEMTREMNALETRHRPLEKGCGALGDLVLARYRDSMWHRAQVVEVFESAPSSIADDTACVRVFYVDFGNCSMVQMLDLRRWSDQWDWVPFQAYECHLAGVRRLGGAADTLSVAEMEALRGLMLFKELRAIVVNNDNDVLVVRLLDTNEIDMGQTICSMGLARSTTDGANE